MEINQTQISEVIQKSQITICPLCSVRYVNEKSEKTNCYFGCNQFHLFCLKCWEKYKAAKITTKIQIKDKNNKIINIAYPCPLCKESILQIKHFRLMTILLQTQNKINKKYQKINLRLKNGISEDQAKKITDMLDQLDGQLIKLQQKNSVLQNQLKNANKKYEQQKDRYKQKSRRFAKQQEKNRQANKQLQILEVQKKQLDKINQLHKVQLMQQTTKIKGLEQTIKKQKLSLEQIQKQNRKLVQNSLKVKNIQNQAKKYKEQLQKNQNIIKNLQVQIKKLSLKKQISNMKQKCQNCSVFQNKIIVKDYQLKEKDEQLKLTKKNYNQVVQKCIQYEFQQKKKSSIVKQQQQKVYQKKKNLYLQQKVDKKQQEQDPMKQSVFQRIAKKLSQKSNEDQQIKSIKMNKSLIKKKQQNINLKKNGDKYLINSIWGKRLDLKKQLKTLQKINQIVSIKWPDDVEYIDLRQNELTNQTFAKIARIKVCKPKKLTTLKLSQNKISSLISLKLFKYDTIQSLFLDDNLLSLEAANQLAQIKWSKLKSLTISFIQPNEYECCCKILQAKQNFQALQTLEIVHSQKYFVKVKQKFLSMKEDLSIKKINFFADNDSKHLQTVQV